MAITTTTSTTHSSSSGSTNLAKTTSNRTSNLVSKNVTVTESITNKTFGEKYPFSSLLSIPTFIILFLMLVLGSSVTYFVANKDVWVPRADTNQLGATSLLNDIPLIKLNGLSLNEVFENTSLLDSEQLLTNGDFSDGTTGWTLSNATGAVTDGIYVFSPNNLYGGIYQSILFTTEQYYFVIRYDTLGETFAFRGSSSGITLSFRPTYGYENYSVIQTMLPLSESFGIIHNLAGSIEPISVEYAYAFNISTLIANKQYSPLYDETFDLMSDEQIKAQMDMFVDKPYLFIDYKTLNLENLTVDKLDDLYALYVEQQDITFDDYYYYIGYDEYQELGDVGWLGFQYMFSENGFIDTVANLGSSIGDSLNWALSGLKSLVYDVNRMVRFLEPDDGFPLEEYSGTFSNPNDAYVRSNQNIIERIYRGLPKWLQPDTWGK